MYTLGCYQYVHPRELLVSTPQITINQYTLESYQLVHPTVLLVCTPQINISWYTLDSYKLLHPRQLLVSTPQRAISQYTLGCHQFVHPREVLVSTPLGATSPPYQLLPCTVLPQVLAGADPITVELGPYVYSAQHIRSLVQVSSPLQTLPLPSLVVCQWWVSTVWLYNSGGSPQYGYTIVVGLYNIVIHQWWVSTIQLYNSGGSLQSSYTLSLI